MGVLSSRKSETSTQVLPEAVHLFYSGEDASIQSLLIGLSLFAHNVLSLLLLFKELTGLLGLSRTLEVGIVDLFRDGDTSKIDLSGGGDNVRLVDTADGDTINLEGT